MLSSYTKQSAIDTRKIFQSGKQQSKTTISQIGKGFSENLDIDTFKMPLHVIDTMIGLRQSIYANIWPTWAM